MLGQIDLDEYLKSINRSTFDILDYIKVGYENAITREELCNITGIPDRMIRQAIHIARRKIPILNMQDSRGYFIPDMNSKEERLMLKRYVQQETSRIKNIGWSLKSARQTLKNCGIDWRDAS